MQNAKNCKGQFIDFNGRKGTFVPQSMKNAMKHLCLFTALVLLAGCGTAEKGERETLLQGAWTLSQAQYPAGERVNYPIRGVTALRIYDGDSAMYQCYMTKTTSGLVVHDVGERTNITLIDKGGSQFVYLEGDNPRPLTLMGDTAIAVQQNGVRYTWLRADSIDKEWGTEIRGIVTDEGNRRESERTSRYVLSAKVREQSRIIHCLAYSTLAFIILTAVVVRIALNNRRERKRLQLQIQQIREEHEKRPQPVRRAIEEVESDFFSSDGYLSLLRRIRAGKRLDQEDWNEIEEQIKKVYPSFGSRLRNLYAMSALERQVCLLIKLRVTPSDMAAVLCRDVSTISTVRSRLYQKVFGTKGGARDWDDFIRSIDT